MVKRACAVIIDEESFSEATYALEEEAIYTISFDSLKPSHGQTDLNVVYLTNKDKLKVENLTWSPMGNSIRVEVYPTSSNPGLQSWGYTFSGYHGNVSNFTISFASLSAGDYRVCVTNVSSSNISGILQYSWV